jgi:hypothetical protein
MAEQLVSALREEAAANGSVPPAVSAIFARPAGGRGRTEGDVPADWRLLRCRRSTRTTPAGCCSASATPDPRAVANVLNSGLADGSVPGSPRALLPGPSPPRRRLPGRSGRHPGPARRGPRLAAVVDTGPGRTCRAAAPDAVDWFDPVCTDLPARSPRGWRALAASWRRPRPG